MKKDNDILQRKELKEMPFSVPEGYFEDFKERALRLARESAGGGEAEAAVERPRGVRKLAPYFAFAATLLIMVAVGTAVLKKTAVPQDDLDEITAYYNILPSADNDAIYYSYNMTEEGPSEEDIIEYLISIGASTETIDELIQY